MMTNVENILRTFDAAEPELYETGINWYLNAHNHIHATYCVQYGVSMAVACGVVAALSPQNPWAQNLVDAHTVLRAVVDGLGADDVRVSTFNANKLKAFRIARGEEPLAVLGGDKVTSFYENLVHPTTSQAVTVDRWAYRIWDGFASEYKPLGRAQYRTIQEDYRLAAAMRGVLPHQLQSVTWSVARGTAY